LLLWLIICTNDTSSVLEINISVYRLLMIGLFSYMLSFAFCFYGIDDMPGWAKVLVNYIFTTAGFFICIYMPTIQELPTEARPEPLIVVALVVIFSLLYFLCFFAYRFAKTLWQKKNHKKNKGKKKIKEPEKEEKKTKNKKEEYVPMFSKTKEK